MHEQLYLEFGEAISHIANRGLARVHPSLGVKVSPCGEVFVPATSNSKAHWTFGSKTRYGYMQVKIARKRYYVHRLTAETYLGQIPRGMEVDHLNRVRDDNRVENLRIVTSSENSRNTSLNDRVTERGGTHWYADRQQYIREYHIRCKAEHPEKVREQRARYRAEHPEKVREKRARYRAKHPEKVREQKARYYAKNTEKECERKARYYQAKCKTHRQVQFADGSRHWLPLPEAEALLAIPLSERIYKENRHV